VENHIFFHYSLNSKYDSKSRCKLYYPSARIAHPSEANHRETTRALCRNIFQHHRSTDRHERIGQYLIPLNALTLNLYAAHMCRLRPVYQGAPILLTSLLSSPGDLEDDLYRAHLQCIKVELGRQNNLMCSNTHDFIVTHMYSFLGIFRGIGDPS